MLRLLLIFLITLMACRCSEDPLESGTMNHNIVFNAYQIPGCAGSGFLKTAINDSCFSYLFEDTLDITFCVAGNCCPDSLRFKTLLDVHADTLFVSVTDTAANLCNCMCGYKIYLNISGLQRERYLFYCNFAIDDDTLQYRETIFK